LKSSFLLGTPGSEALTSRGRRCRGCKRGERAETAAINVVLGNIVGHLGHEAFKCGVLMQTVHYFPINS